jgi:hypothetical protein
MEGSEWQLVFNVENHINEFTYRARIVSDSNAISRREGRFKLRSLIKARLRDTVRMAKIVYGDDIPAMFLVYAF